MQFFSESHPIDQRESQACGFGRRYNVVFARAIGSVLVDDQGRRYIDFLGSSGALNYGHNDPDIMAALVSHVQSQGLGAGVDLHSQVKQRFVQAFSSLVLAPRGFSHRLQFTGPSATDAMDAALELARKVTGRQGVVAFTGSHVSGALGRSMRSAWRSPYDGAFGASVDTAEHLATLLEQPGSGVAAPAAVVLESVQIDGGLQAASPGWMRRIAAVARQNGALLVLDDSMAGGGRCGGFFSFEGLDLSPDLVLPSQSLSGLSLPMGLLLVRPDRDLWSPAEHGSHFQHNHHAFASSVVACTKFWTDGRLQNLVAQRSGLLSAGLQGICNMVPGAKVLGKGMARGLALGDAKLADDVVSCCLDRGLLVQTSGPSDSIVRLLPPLTTPTLLLEQAMAILYRAVASASGLKARSVPHRALAAVHAAARQAARDAAQPAPTATPTLTTTATPPSMPVPIRTPGVAQVKVARPAA